MNTNEVWVPMKDPKYCFVPSCKNKSSLNPEKHFFCVPKLNKQEWCSAVGAKCPKRVLYVCEDHLNLEEDLENYRYWSVMKGRANLKSRVPQSLSLVHHVSRPSMPSIQLTEERPCHSKGVQVRQLEEGRLFQHKGTQIKPKTMERTTYCDIKQIKSKPVDKTNEVMADCLSIDELPSTQGSTNSADVSEVSSEFTPKYEGRAFMLKLVQKKPLCYLGLPKTYYWLISYLENHIKIKAFDIIITLYKIKNNVPYSQISDMFEVSVTTLWRIFPKTLIVLSKFFNQLIFCPSVFDVKNNLPPSFNINSLYSNTFCIIDSFEIEIEKPSNPIDQALTWSQYKSANTIKYLLATTPDGFVNFVSAGFGGRISDTSLVENCGILNVLPQNCTILADRGFKHIEALLSKNNIKLLRPPSVAKGIILSKQDAIKSKVIASLRIHVERVIRRVRVYKFLKPHSVINNKLIQHTDDVVKVACGLINLHSPIINMNKG